MVIRCGWSPFRDDGPRAGHGGRLGRGLSLVIVAAVAFCLFAAAGEAASVRASAGPFEPLGTPVEDPLQTQLEKALLAFDQRAACSSALLAYQAAEKLDRSLRMAFSSLVDAKAALSSAQSSELGLMYSRLGLLAAQGALFAATAPETEAAVAALGTAGKAAQAAKAWSNYVGAGISALSVIPQAIAAHKWDYIDTVIGSLGTANAAIGTETGTLTGLLKAAGSPAAGAVLQLVGAVKTIHDTLEDVDQFFKDAGAAENAYAEAGGQYALLLPHFELAVTKMKTAFADCPKKHAVGGQIEVVAAPYGNPRRTAA